MTSYVPIIVEAKASLISDSPGGSTGAKCDDYDCLAYTAGWSLEFWKGIFYMPNSGLSNNSITT